MNDNDPVGPRVSGRRIFFTIVILLAVLLLMAAIVFKPMQKWLTTEAPAPAAPVAPAPPPQWQSYYVAGDFNIGIRLVIETATGNRWLVADGHGTAIVPIPNVPYPQVEKK